MISMPFTLKINSSTTQEEYLETIEPLMDLIAYAGCQTMTKIEERDKLVFFPRSNVDCEESQRCSITVSIMKDTDVNLNNRDGLILVVHPIPNTRYFVSV